MEDKIFIERNRSIKAVNKENKVNVNLTQKARLLPYNNITDALNLHDLFLAERDACSKYRLIFTVNPVCSNVLFNMKTEVVYREGSNECQALVGEDEDPNSTSIVRAVLSPAVSNTVEPVTRTQAIRDTEYSHPNVGKVVYHCGADIFNNHMLRSTGFNHINRMNKVASGICGTVFNTIEDYVRDGAGNLVTEVIGETTKLTEGYVHQYRIDNIISMEDAFAKQVRCQDGWYGFDNVGFMEIPNGADGTLCVNKLMNNNKACEFIDFYPDRSLFSFIPKVNKERHRVEKNWDYCITYPYKSDYESYNNFTAYFDRNMFVSGYDYSMCITYAPKDSHGKYINGIRCTHKKVVVGGNHDYYVFSCQIAHNLTYGDTVRMYDHSGNTKELFVMGLGDSAGNDKEHCFRVYENEFKQTDKFGLDERFHWFKKLSNQTGCEYYFRTFKKLVDEDGKIPDSSINKLAFGENIYGDRTAQIIFTEDIDVTGLKDNRGRPLSELYLTIVKANRGYKKWYNQNIFNDPDIEFSHCFGDVTSGVQTIPSEYDFNVRRLHNANLSQIKDEYVDGTIQVFGPKFLLYNDSLFNQLVLPRAMETGITVDSKATLFGDIVEFDPSKNKETILTDVYYRFNTAQRETKNPMYFDILEDQLMHDDYDEGVLYQNFTGQLYPGEDNFYMRSDVEVTGFTVERNVRKNRISETPEGYGVDFLFPGNINPEGYYYKAHYKVPIREISSSAQTQIGAVIEYDVPDVNAYTTVPTNGGSQNFVDVTVHKDYQFIVGDLFGLYRESENRLVWGILDSFTYLEDDGGIRLKIEVSEQITYDEFKDGSWQLVLTDGSVPTYASYVKKEQKFVWRDVLKPSEATSASGLEDVMYTNGAIYMHTNINFFLKRQDPTGEYGLLAPRKGSDGQDFNPLRKFKKHGTIADFSQLLYLAAEAQNACM